MPAVYVLQEEQEKCGKPLTVEEFTAAQADALRELGVDIDLESGGLWP